MRKKLLTLALTILSAVAFSATNIYAPTLVSPANNAGGAAVSLLLDWNAVPGAISYKVEYTSDTSFTNASVILCAVTATTINDLFFGTVYSWRVKAYGVSDSSAWSATFKFTTTDKVTMVKPVDSTHNRFTTLPIQWTSIAGVSTYEYEADTVNTFDSPLHMTQSFVGTEIKGNTNALKFGRFYFMRMRAKDAADTSGWGNILHVWTIDTVYLKKPANDTVNTFSNVAIQWKYNGAKDYQVSIATDSAFASEVIYNVDSTHIYFNGTIDTLVTTKEDLAFNTQYYFRVRGTNVWGTSVWSAVRKFKTLDCVTMLLPANLATGVSTLPELKWSVAGADNFEIQLDTSMVYSNPQIFHTTDTTVHYIITTELLPHTTYYWRVRAIHTTDTTSWCAGRSFETNGGAGISHNSVSLNNISIYPNPSKSGMVYIQVNSNLEQEITVIVSNLFGQDIYNEKHSLGNGQNNIKLDLSNSGNGIYLVKVINAGNAITRKIVLDK